MKAARTRQKFQQPESLLDYVRQSLTPWVWKPARQAIPKRRQAPRWDLQPLVLILMALTGTAGESQPEKFEKARRFYVACYEARRRPGKTLEGFQKALGRIPMRQFRGWAAGVRRRIHARLGPQRLVEGFEPMGCDGSRIERPRTPEWEARLGEAGKSASSPTVWVTAFVPLPTGLLWSWRLGPGTAAEQVPLRALLGTLSPEALIIGDAA